MASKDFGERLDDILTDVTEKGEELRNNFKTMSETTKKDIKDWYTKSATYLSDIAGKIGDKHDKAFEYLYMNEVGKDFLDTLQKYAQDPAKLKEKYKEKREQYNSKLDEMAYEKPELVGLIDGLSNSVLASDLNRRPRSKIYTTHRKYGAVAGWGASAWATLSGRVLLGAVPWVTHGYKYMKNAYMQAAAKNTSEKAA